MFRVLPYITLLLTAVISQVFIFDNLSLSVYAAPLVYIVFIILLPVESSQILMLGAGVGLGFILDAVMGTDGLNSIATIFIAYFRSPLLKRLVGRERAAERGTPSEVMLGSSDYLIYLILMVGLHHLIFFSFESLTFHNLQYTLIRFVVSTSISLLFVWLIARFFVNNKILK